MESKEVNAPSTPMAAGAMPDLTDEQKERLLYGVNVLFKWILSNPKVSTFLASLLISLGFTGAVAYKSLTPPAVAPEDAVLAAVTALRTDSEKAFAGQTAILKDIRDALVKKPDPEPNPNPNPPKPSGALSLSSVDVAARVNVPFVLKAVCKTGVQWHVSEDAPCSVDIVGNNVIVTPTAEKDFAFAASALIDGKMEVRIAMVRSGAGPPNPNPNPNPPNPNPKPPTPTPTVPLNEFGKLVLMQAQKVNKPADAKALSSSYAECVSAIRAGGVKTPEAAVKMLFDRNSQILGVNKAWSGFFTWADNELTRRFELGQLSTMAQHADHFEQMAAAFAKAGQ